VLEGTKVGIVVALIMIGAAVVFFWVLLAIPRLCWSVNSVWEVRDNIWWSIHDELLGPAQGDVKLLLDRATEAADAMNDGHLTLGRSALARWIFRPSRAGDLAEEMAREYAFWQLDGTRYGGTLEGEQAAVFKELHQRLIVAVVPRSLLCSWAGVVVWTVLAGGALLHWRKLGRSAQGTLHGDTEAGSNTVEIAGNEEVGIETDETDTAGSDAERTPGVAPGSQPVPTGGGTGAFVGFNRRVCALMQERVPALTYGMAMSLVVPRTLSIPGRRRR
jgi:hypothetical protein